MAFLCPEHSPELPRSRNSPSGYFLRLPLNYTLSAKAVHACALLLSRLPCIHLFPRRLNIGPFHPTCNGLFNPTINGPYIPTCSGPFHPTLTRIRIDNTACSVCSIVLFCLSTISCLVDRDYYSKVKEVANKCK